MAAQIELTNMSDRNSQDMVDNTVPSAPTIEIVNNTNGNNNEDPDSITVVSSHRVVARNNNAPRQHRQVNPFPSEIRKTLFMLALQAPVFYINALSLVVTHHRHYKAHSNDTHPEPLQDFLLDLIHPIDWGLQVAEVIILICSFLTLLMIFLHQHRWILLRRCCFFLAVLYFLRSITIFVTILPSPSYTFPCSTNLNMTTLEIVKEATYKFIGLGLNILERNELSTKTFCGDYMFSGHTIILVLTALFADEYLPRDNKKWFLLRWIMWALCYIGMAFLLFSRSHYTIDLIFSYLLTTRLFYNYHTVANNPILKQSPSSINFIGREFWYRLFYWLEGNVTEEVPREYVDLSFYINKLRFSPRATSTTTMSEEPVTV